MSVITRCRRCGRQFVADRRAILAGAWRLCEDCRNPEPPAGEKPTSSGGAVLTGPPGAAP